MSSEFNPYSRWLKIPQNEQPPTYYRLLDLARFEADCQVIESSVSRLVAKLQDLSSGKNVEQAQRLLNEVAQARLCLTDPIRKAEYDQGLRTEIDPAKPNAIRPPALASKVVPPEKEVKSSSTRTSSTRTSNARTSNANSQHALKSKKKPGKKSGVKPIVPVGLVVGLGVAALLVAGLALWLKFQPAGAVPPSASVAVAEARERAEDSVRAIPREPKNNPAKKKSSKKKPRVATPAADLPPIALAIPEVPEEPVAAQSMPAEPLPAEPLPAEPLPDLPATVPPMASVGAMQPDQLEAFREKVREVVYVEGVVVSIGESGSGKTRYFRFSDDWDLTIRVAMLEREFGKEWMDANLPGYVGKKIRVSGIIDAQPRISQEVELSIRDESEIEIVE